MQILSSFARYVIWLDRKSSAAFGEEAPHSAFGRVQPNHSRSPPVSGESVSSCLGAVGKPFKYKEREPIIEPFGCIRKCFAVDSFDFSGFANTVLYAWA